MYSDSKWDASITLAPFSSIKVYVIFFKIYQKAEFVHLDCCSKIPILLFFCYPTGVLRPRLLSASRFLLCQTYTNLLIIHRLMSWNYTGDSWTTVFAPARMPALLNTGRRSPAFLPPALWRIPLTETFFFKFHWLSRLKFECNSSKYGKRLESYLWLRDLQIRHHL